FELNPLNASFPSHLLLSVDHLPPSTCGLSYQKVVHGGSKLGSFVCHICNKSFAQKGNMTIHMRTHTGMEVIADVCDSERKGYFCRICSFPRPSLSSLKKHMQTHMFYEIHYLVFDNSYLSLD
ncbi:hypothetical protein CDAR_529521, partial [Caerostris darwini]